MSDVSGPWTGAGIDPRIRARRVAVARAAGRRRLHRLLLVVALAAVAATAALVTYSPALAVEQVRVRGLHRLPADAVVEAAAVDTGAPLAWLDLDEVRRRVAGLPAVESVSVRRAWPHAVEIQVRERVPVAAVAAADGTRRAVDRHGVVLGPVTGVARLVAVDGAVAAGEPGTTVDPALRDALRVAAALPASLAVRTTAVAVAAEGPVLRLAPAGEVHLHGTDRLAEKLLGALAVLDEVGVDQVAVLDVGVPDAPVLTRSAA